MCHEIHGEILIWEKEGDIKFLEHRARSLAVRVKEDKTLHDMALRVYRDILDISRHRESTDDYDSTSQLRVPDSSEPNSSLVRDSRELTISPEMPPIDEKFDKFLSIELPTTLEEESSTPKESALKIYQGEPGEQSVNSLSCEILSIGDVSGEASLFEVPAEEEGTTRGAYPGGTTEHSDGEDSNRPRSNRNGAESKEQDGRDSAELKISLPDEEPTQVLGNFPGKDFKSPIQWTIDRISHNATNIADLRNKYNIVIEGEFRKRCRSHKWQKYYGFFFDTGVMIYFRKGEYKKVVDFRQSKVSVLGGKPSRLSIEDVYVDSSETDWLLKFDRDEHFQSWYDTIRKFSIGLKK